ncbi:MAG: DUF5009 domain-containing protein [Chitinophagaceae bacterium]
MQRNKSLDALRGLAILLMVLSSSIAFGILPAWMYHAQTPPPSHVFVPTLAGISWVDLVFPFFLFSMGAAIPLALNKKVTAGTGFYEIGYTALRRFIILVFFAFFTVHARSAVISSNPQTIDYLLSIGAFVLIFFQLYRPAGEKYKKLFIALQVLAYALAVVMLIVLPFKDGKGFSWQRSDIIILVLANMALFGTLLWWLTRNNPLLRVGILLFVMAVFLSKGTGTWTDALFQWSPIPWAYKFYYLKYLFIIIPGTIAGDWLIRYPITLTAETKEARGWIRITALLSFALVVLNVVLLFGRFTFINLLVSVAICTTLLVYAERAKAALLYQQVKLFLQAGTFLLLLGLFFEAYEGGIKKDPSTYSYYFVTSGLAFFMMIALYGCQFGKAGGAVINYLSLNGKNPMVAYVTGNLLLLPLLHLSGAMQGYLAMQKTVIPGFLSGVLFTGIVSLVTVFFTKKGWLWKT